MNAADYRIGIALSGGGFRAASFHLGVLKRLEELGILRDVKIISTVSGGSITGPLYALRCMEWGGAPGAYPVDDLINDLRPLITSNLRGRALFGGPVKALRTTASFIAPWISRISLIADELDRRLFHGARVSDLPPWIVLNATSLSTGKAWKFFHDRMGDYLMGATTRTDKVRLAEAVAASAAYPVLVDPLPLRLRWEELRHDLLDARWDRGETLPGETSRWRERFGKREGPVVVPLVDGGVYDNEGLISLRSAGVTHAIVSSAAPPEGNHRWRRGPGALVRAIDVMHSRLGAITRQLAHESTHGIHPSEARRVANEVAEHLRRLAVETPRGINHQLIALADELERVADVGWPPRGKQLQATSHVLLHRDDVAENRCARFEEDPYNIPPEDRGLAKELVAEVSRVRTDLDALEPDVFDMLVAQGYFLADAQLKIAMPRLVSRYTGTADPRGPTVRPSWPWAHDVVRVANGNLADSRALLRRAAHRTLPAGRCATRGEAVRIWSATAFCAATLVVTLLLCLKWAF